MKAVGTRVASLKPALLQVVRGTDPKNPTLRERKTNHGNSLLILGSK